MKVRNARTTRGQRVQPLGVADLVGMVVELFPSQHPACSAWTRGLAGGSTGAGDATAVAGAAAPRPEGRLAEPTSPRAGSSGTGSPGKGNPSPQSGQPSAGPSTAPRPASPLPAAVPGFAKELRGTTSEWEAHQGGLDLSWSDEQKLIREVAEAAGLADPARGFSGALLAMSADRVLPSGLEYNVEVLVARRAQPSEVLLSAGAKGRARRYFAVAFSNLSPDRVRDLAIYVAGQAI